MNSVHDMGGTHGLGAIENPSNEPVFHERWEGRTFAMNRAISAWRLWTIDASRHAVELIPGPDYLRMTYYEKWFTRLCHLLLKRGLITPPEMASGKAETVKVTPPLTAERVSAAALNSTVVSTLDHAIAPVFAVGQRVRAKNIHPIGHTRLPRYARGRLGVIERDHGVYPFPDTAAHGLGEKRQHVYSVRFTARELWGAEASAHDSLYLDLWDDYLELS